MLIFSTQGVPFHPTVVFCFEPDFSFKSILRTCAYLPPYLFQKLFQGSSVIERELTKEIGLLREAHAGSLQGTDGSTVNQIFLGKRDKEFSFADLKTPVDFCEASVLNEDNLDKIQGWITTHSC